MNSLERDRTFNLVPRVFSLSNIGKLEDPGNEVGERLSWLGQAREFILIKTLSVLPWGHWRQISHQSAPPSNRLFVITRIEDTWPDPACKGLSNLGTRLLTCNMASRFVTGLEDKGAVYLYR